jgi:predicted transcriptional regulator
MSQVKRKEYRIEHRNSYQIIAQMLELALEPGVLKTQLMNGCKLSYFELQKFMSYLQKNGLLGYVVDNYGKKHYVTTKKGKDLLDELKVVEEYLPPID